MVADDTTKLYCSPCGTGDSRPVDQILVTAASSCTAVAGKCSGNKVTATTLAKLTGSTYGFDCGAGHTAKSSAVAFSGADAAAQKAVCCTVTPCGNLASGGTLKTGTCGCGTDEEVKELGTDKLYCATCPSGKARSASTTAVAIAVACIASSAPTAAPTTAPTASTSNSTSNSTTTIPASATATVAAGKILVEVTSTVTFFEALNDKNQSIIIAAYCKAVGTIDDIVPGCTMGLSSKSKRRLLEKSVSYDLSAKFVVSNTTVAAFSAKAAAKQETAKAEFLKDADVLTANDGNAPTYVSNTVEVDGVKVTTAAPTDDKKKDDWSGSSTLAVSFGVMCSMFL